MHPVALAALRTPKRPHRRERAIVPGVRDPLPVGGRLTFKLLDPRSGRTVHKQVAENDVTTHLREAAVTWTRGADQTGLFGFDGGVTGLHGTNTDTPTTSITSTYPHVYGRFSQFLGSIYLSSADDAFDPDWWFPLGLEAGADLHANNAFTDNKRRGARQTGAMVRDSDRNLFVVDFGINDANGFSIESAGFAGLTYPGTDGFDGVYGWMTGSAILGNFSPPIGGRRLLRTALLPSGNEVVFWSLGEDGLSKIDLTTTATWGVAGDAAASQNPRTISGPTLATLGIASAANSGLAIIGTDLWVGDVTRLRKMALPTNTSMPSVANTYSPVTGFTDANILALATDGTDLYALGSTKVFVISAATGAVTSSWTHNVTAARGMNYDQVHDILWLIGTSTTAYPTDGYLLNENNWVVYERDQAHAASSSGFSSIYPYTKAGTPLGYGIHPFFGNSALQLWDTLLILDQGHIIGPVSRRNNDNSSGHVYPWNSGGMLGSRALVPSPFTKTSANPLRIEYEVGFPT